jgi:hypothetical protein
MRVKVRTLLEKYFEIETGYFEQFAGLVCVRVVRAR